MTQPDSIILHRLCRNCRGPLEEVLRLGTLRLNAFPESPEAAQQVPAVPHTLAVCTQCSLVQLTHTVPADWMYRTYWYQSSVNETMRAELQGIVREASVRADVAPGDWVLDIGANDGTLLSNYAAAGAAVKRAAVEPARNLHDALNQHCDVLIGDYFPTSALDNLTGQFKVISAVAMCYDLEQPVPFFAKLEQLLHPQGVAIVQFQDLGQQIQACAFDNICPEHLEYYTLGSLMEVLDQAGGLRVVDCRTTPINGGSLRVTLMRQQAVPKASVYAQLQREQAQGLLRRTIAGGDLGALTRFAQRVKTTQDQISALLQISRDQGYVIDIWGASTKGNVTQQVLGLDAGNIRQAIDRDPRKWGRYTITGVPIVGEAEGAKDPADLALVCIWQFRDSILSRGQEYLNQGGRLLFPLPVVELVVPHASLRTPR